MSTPLCRSAARDTPTVETYLFTSSVCIYPTDKLAATRVTALTEEAAIPANPQGIYGWEKLWTERMCMAYREQYGLNTHIVRLQNTYGPLCEWRDENDHPNGHRTKAPAALSRKIAVASITGRNKIDVWGDGKATRTFMNIADCVRGIATVAYSQCNTPVTLGPDRVISINDLVRMLAKIAGVTIEINHVDGPEGVRGRNFDHTLIHSLGWKPRVTLERGMRELYEWVYTKVYEQIGGAAC